MKPFRIAREAFIAVFVCSSLMNTMYHEHPPLGQKNCAKIHPQGNVFQKSSKKENKTWDRNYEKQYLNV